ncbi:unnamed protein product [Ixodes pacificus]
MAMSTPREARHRTLARRAPHLLRLRDDGGADGDRDGAPGALTVVAWEGGRPVGLPNGAAASTPPRRRHPTARPLRRVAHPAAPGSRVGNRLPVSPLKLRDSGKQGGGPIGGPGPRQPGFPGLHGQPFQ